VASYNLLLIILPYLTITGKLTVHDPVQLFVDAQGKLSIEKIAKFPE
jgi:hypothetical protein